MGGRMSNVSPGLVCFNNFYYCRFGGLYWTSTQGQYALIISTIVDPKYFADTENCGQYALIISTIVDTNDESQMYKEASML